MVRFPGDGEGFLLRRLLPPLGCAADRRRNRAVAAHRRPGSRTGDHSHGAQSAGGGVLEHRLVRIRHPKGGAREKAEELAQEIARFPQVCVRADRRSAIKSHGLSVREALIQEWYNGREALIEDGVAGASRFKDGLGRHGDFDKI